MKILCVLTDSHKILFDNYFIKTIPCPENVIVRKLGIEGDGSYKSESWQKAVNTKTELVISYLEKIEDGTFFLFSDVDVQFFSNFSLDKLKYELINSKKDILFQKENTRDDNHTINSGFYVAKSSNRLLIFFKQVLEGLNNSEVKSDQKIINLLLKDSVINWGFLPNSYYAMSHGFPPPDTIYCHHANNAGRVTKKIDQFVIVRKYLESGYFNKILIVLNFMIRGKLLSLMRRKFFKLLKLFQQKPFYLFFKK